MRRLLCLAAVVALPSLAQANCINGTTGVVGSGTCAETGSVLIATLSAPSAALTFYGSNWSSSYGTLRLHCRGLVLTADTSVLFQVGEGGGGGLPTWQSSASYHSSGEYVTASGTPSGWYVSNATDLLDGFTGSPSGPSSFFIEIDNVSSTTIGKLASFVASASNVGTAYPGFGVGQWTGDTAAITGIRIIPGTGTISNGSCSLYGLLQ